MVYAEYIGLSHEIIYILLKNRALIERISPINMKIYKLIIVLIMWKTWYEAVMLSGGLEDKQVIKQQYQLYMYFTVKIFYNLDVYFLMSLSCGMTQRSLYGQYV